MLSSLTAIEVNSGPASTQKHTPTESRPVPSKALLVVVIVTGSSGNAYRWAASTGLAKLGPGAPTAINDHGQTVGDSTIGDAFLWSRGSRS